MKIKKFLITGVFVTMALVLSACAMGPRAVGTPGLTAEGDVVYVSYMQYVYAVNAQTGIEVWRYPAKGSAQVMFYAPPTVTDDAVFVGDLANKFHKLNKTTGAALWTFEGAKGWFIGQAVVSSDTVYASSSDRFIYALDSANGSLKWKFETGHQNWSQPVVINNEIVLASLDHSVYALDMTGKVLWQTELNGAIVGSPITDDANEKVYVGTIGQAFYALDVKTGKVAWQFDTKSSLWSAPLFAEGTLLICDEAGTVYSVDPITGKALWTTEVGGKVMGGLLAIEGGFVVVTEDSTVRGFDFDRNPLWTRTVSGELYTAPVKTAENIIIAAIKGDNLLYGFDLTGNQEWVFKPAN
jgi:outer membrane protein assembly factor BamB